uniref:Reverse transcriptase domain-containing protein n=1 Tax=Strongyloides papillosus TaxID=174720 RepID=A0A0N5BPZ4_STREA
MNNDITLPFLESETRAAIYSCGKNKMKGVDGLNAYDLRCLGNKAIRYFTLICNMCLKQVKHPPEWKTVKCLFLYKKKGNKDCLSSYRPLSICSHGYKIYAKMILNRIQKKILNEISETQFEFRPNYSCSDAIICLENIFHTHHTYKLNLLTALLDFRKAYDLVYKEYIWYNLNKIGIEKSLILILKDLNVNIKCVINPEYGSDITIYPSRGIRQGCPISSLLYNFNLEMAMRNAFMNNNMVFKYGVNITGSKVPNLCFADDTCLLANSWNDLSLMVDKFIRACQPVGMKLNMNKCKILMSKELSIQYEKNKHVPLNLADMQISKEEEYLGKMVSITEKRCFLKQVRNRAWKAFYSIRKYLNISLRARKLLFVTRIRSSMCYAAQSWTTTQAERNNLLSVERSIIRRLKLIPEDKWLIKEEDNTFKKLSNEDMYRKIGICNLNRHLAKLKIKFIYKKIDKNGIVQRCLCWYPHGTKKRIGRPRDSYFDCFKRSKCVGKNRFLITLFPIFIYD